MWARLRSFVWRDVSGTVRGGGNDRSNGSRTVVSSDIHPPFRIVTSWHDGGLEREGKKILPTGDELAHALTLYTSFFAFFSLLY